MNYWMKLQGSNGYFKRPAGIMGMCLLFALPCPAQERIPLNYQSTVIGMGKTQVYDSYLSPLQYTGTHLNLLEERMQPVRWGNDKIAAQQLFFFDMASTLNPAATAISYSGNLEYAYGLYYRLEPIAKVQLLAGVQAGGLLGAIYNPRNSNNPFSAKVDAGLNISVIAAYRFRMIKQPLEVRYQLIIPTVGWVFSPEYGQSYYEIGLENDTPLMHFASFHNRWAARNLLSLELPFPGCTLRLTYMNRLYATQINGLKTQTISNTFGIGISKYFYTVSGRKINHHEYQKVFE
ncbi:MAG: hypothetical protein EZS26_000817 [Candidatus Ordinivivax streblomastigis]|uniref:DUF3316 domain-containing protein n=1 Tax=Candidatus Ordinivivax streblomastigis TaxID=2540710 RepID=A0A5M8P3K0_9BACT|nr:MAG: hypothetical protein EZS26_000817 [Candidatus Ordinivivax streblomastigis]